MAIASGLTHIKVRIIINIIHFGSTTTRYTSTSSPGPLCSLFFQNGGRPGDEVGYTSTPDMTDSQGQTPASAPEAVRAARQAAATGTIMDSASTSATTSANKFSTSTTTHSLNTSTTNTTAATVQANVATCTSTLPNDSNLQGDGFKQLMARVQVLEEQNKMSPESIIKKINDLAFKSDADFDKYQALSLAQSLVFCTQDSSHKKAPFYAAALQELRARMNKPTRDFKAYFLALFADSDYSKVLESIARVEKSLRTPSRPSRASQSACFRCGRPGHYANRCRQRPYNVNPRKNYGSNDPKPLL